MVGFNWLVLVSGNGKGKHTPFTNRRKKIRHSQIEENKKNQLLRYLLQDEVRKLIPVIMKLGILDKPQTPIETYIQYVLNNEEDKAFKKIAEETQDECVQLYMDVIKQEKEYSI